MPRLAIIEPVACAGGIERFVHGLIRGAIEQRITDDWEIVLIRKRVNTAGIHVPWPEHLKAPSISIEYLESENSLARTLERLSTARRLFGIPGSGSAQRKLAQVVRSAGPARWRAYCGDSQSRVEIYLRSHHFDVVYCPYPDLVKPPRISQPIVVTVQDFTSKHVPPASAYERRMRDNLIRRWLSVSCRVINSSQFVADDLKRFYPSFAYKAQVIRFGIPAASRIPSNEEVLEFCRRRALPQRFVLTVGWMFQHKNQHVVFEAIAKLRERGMHIPLVCVGPDSKSLNDSYSPKGDRRRHSAYISKILAICREMELRNGADYFALGFVDDLEMECLYRSATMLVFPSIAEGFGLPSLEAMRAGCPVVFSRIPPFAEIAELVGDNAWSFPADDSTALADAIVEVANNPDEAQRRAQEAKSLAPHIFSWERTAAEYFSVFAQVAGRAAPGPGNRPPVQSFRAGCASAEASTVRRRSQAGHAGSGRGQASELG